MSQAPCRSVQIAHRFTRNLEELVRSAECLIVAAGARSAGCGPGCSADGAVPAPETFFKRMAVALDKMPDLSCEIVQA